MSQPIINFTLENDNTCMQKLLRAKEIFQYFVGLKMAMKYERTKMSREFILKKNSIK